MHVLYITYCDGNGPAGHGAHIRGVVESLLHAGHSVTLLAPNYPESMNNRFKLVKIPMLRRKGFMGISYTVSASLVLIYHVLTGRINKDTLAYFRFFNSLSVLQYIVRRFTAAVILVEFNASIEKEHAIYGRSKLKTRAINRNISRTCRYSDGVIAVSEAVKESLVRNGFVHETAVRVVENAVDRHVFVPRERDACRSALGIHRESFMVCYTGALQVYQGLDDVCQSMEYLVPPMDGVMLYLVGDGNEMAPLKNYVEKNHLTDRVHFVGWQPPEKVAQYIGASDLCVAPYNRLASAGSGGKTRYGDLLKGSPMKIFSYLSCGRPTVATHFKEAGVLVQTIKAGLAVPTNAPGALAKAIAYLYQRPDKRRQMCENARHYAEQHLSWDHVARTIVEYAGIPHRNHPGPETGLASGERKT